MYCSCRNTPTMEEGTVMTTAQVGYTPVHRWVKYVLGSTHTTVVLTVAWVVLCLRRVSGANSEPEALCAHRRCCQRLVSAATGFMSAQWLIHRLHWAAIPPLLACQGAATDVADARAYTFTPAEDAHGGDAMVDTLAHPCGLLQPCRRDHDAPDITPARAWAHTSG